MGPLTAIPSAIRALSQNPILVLITGLYGLLQLPQLFLQSQHPIVAAAFSLLVSAVLIFLIPFFQGGLIEMASEALAGQTSLGTLIEAGKSNYIALLLGYFVLFAINFAFGVIVFFAVLFGVIGFAAGGAQPETIAIAILAAIGLLIILAYLLVWFFIQFYAHAIVLSDTELVDGFRRSVRLVRQNLLSVAGYSLILVVGGIVFGVLGGGASIVFSPEQPPWIPLPEPTPLLLGGAALVYLLALAIGGAFYATYSVAFYQELDSRDADQSEQI